MVSGGIEKGSFLAHFPMERGFFDTRWHGMAFRIGALRFRQLPSIHAGFRRFYLETYHATFHRE